MSGVVWVVIGAAVVFVICVWNYDAHNEEDKS